MKNLKTDAFIKNILVYGMAYNLLVAVLGLGGTLKTMETADTEIKADPAHADSSDTIFVRYDPALPRLTRDTCALRQLLQDNKPQKTSKSKVRSDLIQILGRNQKHR